MLKSNSSQSSIWLFVFWTALALAVVSVISQTFSHKIFEFIEHSSEPHLAMAFFVIAVISALSFLSYYLAHERPVPSFVLALLLGIAAKPFPISVIDNHTLLTILVGAGATLILSQGGFETEFSNFRKLFWKIAMLAFPGVLISAITLSFTTVFVGDLLGTAIPVTVAILLGAILASTDPAAIIPLLKNVRFKKNTTKDIVISESAMNDVVGAILTLTLVGLVVKNGFFETIMRGYAQLFTQESGKLLMTQIVFGVLFGAIGWMLLKLLSRHKHGHGFESGADAAYFISVPLLAFSGSIILGGSGYLAAFIAGLLFQVSDHLKKTEHFFGHLIDGFAKPVIFIILGALVDINALVSYAGVGIITGLIFMFVLRPLVVFLMVGPFVYLGKEKLNIKELLFISWVRETGAIPAVLLVTVMSLKLENIESLVPIGMWVILLTLILQPPLTPWFARWLGIAESEKK